MKGRNHDNDRGYRNPRAWFKLKQLFGHMANGLPELGRHVERLSDEHGTCVRLVLAAAVHAFAALPPEQRKHALMGYFSWDRKSAPQQRPKPETPAPPVRSDADDEDGEEWKRGGVAEWPASGNLPGWLTWIRELVLLPYGAGHGRRLIRLDVAARRIEATPNIHLSEIRDAVADARRTAPSEDLPEDEQVPETDFNRAVWSILAPAGWPFPPNLPASGVTLQEPWREGMPPMINSTVKGPLTMHCVHCGGAYSDPSALRRHLLSKHGWTVDADGSHVPPPVVSTERKAA